MVASDEAWHGDGPDVSRPMTLVELCRKGPLKGSMTCNVHRWQTLDDYRSILLMSLFLPLGVVMLLAVVGQIATGVTIFVVSSLGTLLVALIAVAVNNYKMTKLLWALRRDPMATILSGRQIQDLIEDPICGALHSFRYNTSRQPDYSINRSDGDGYQVVLLRFTDDHDRVMFRLAS